jgi:cation diffusion facilitator CzcD-associated flavoprotein CzcO
VPSEVYTFSFDLNPDWSCSYAPQPEILAYMRRCAADHGLTPHVRLSTGVTAAHWDDAEGVWRLDLSTGETETFDAVVGAVGLFGELQWPAAPGREEFKGVLFHSGQWPERDGIDGKTVAVIGTAASAVQFIPKIAERAAQLQVYQRSAHWVLPKEVEHYDEAERTRRRTDPNAMRDVYDSKYQLMDELVDWVAFEDVASREALCRENIATVKDPDLREKLTPKTPWGCTRPLLSNEYYPTYNRDNVELICGPIGRFTANGVVDAEGVERHADVIVCATGFTVERFIASIPVSGRGGASLDDAWRDGARAYLGVVTAGFPNLFMLYGPNTNNGSILYMIECQTDYIVRRLRRMDAENVDWIDVRPEVMETYNAKLMDEIDKVKVWTAGCHNYYSNAAGRIVTQYPRGMTSYREATSVEDWDAYQLKRRAPVASKA